MDYIEVNFTVSPKNPGADILTAELGEIGFDSFVETDQGVLAYIPNENFSEEKIKELILFLDKIAIFQYAFKLIKAQNWNAVWESSFEPIIVSDKCVVRAPFHVLDKEFDFDIIIEPKMSFGTGHHETTFLMMEMMLDMDLKNQSVLDMGCGTAVLAVLAQKLGAKEILAIDNDEWARNNALENILKNNAPDIKVLLGNANELRGKYFNTIFANINRNILLEDMCVYVETLQPKGNLLMSGFFTTDVPLIKAKAEALGLTLVEQRHKNNWTMLNFVK